MIMTPPRTIRYVEFYAGVGGWTMAIEKALQRLDNHRDTEGQDDCNDTNCHEDSWKLHCCAALDHSDVCSQVYQYNHTVDQPDDYVVTPSRMPTQKRHSKKKRRMQRIHKHTVPSVRKPRTPAKANQTTRIEDLTMEQVCDWKAHIWMMSPPCQPHTRQHTPQSQREVNDDERQESTNTSDTSINNNASQRSDLKDPRSASFLHLCRLLQTMPRESLPKILLLENVVGFETSQSFQDYLLSALRGPHNSDTRPRYRLAQFLLQPTQVGIPNDRPRYYAIALLQSDVSSSDTMGQTLTQKLMQHYFSSSLDDLVLHDAIPELGVPRLVETDQNPVVGLESSVPRCSHCEQTKVNASPVFTLAPLSSIIEDINNNYASLQVPGKLLQKQAAWCFDIVTPDMHRSACFTSGYGRYIRGTGSILYTGPLPRDKEGALQLHRPQDRTFDADWVQDIPDPRQLRYFSGAELTRLFGFTQNFGFPESITVKQQWKLMGNSLNVKVAATLLELALKVTYFQQ